MSPKRLAFYRLEADGEIVQVIGKAREQLTLADPLTNETWTIRAAPFEERLAEGYIQRVEPVWRPASEA